MSDIRSEMTELHTQLDHTTDRLHEAEHALIQTKTELRNTMKQLIESRDECSTCEEQNESLKLQVTSIENELSQSRRQNSKLQGELSLAIMGIENLKHETNRRLLQHMSMQVNGSSAHGANEYINITPFATSYDYNHVRTCTTAGSMINNLADPSQRVSNSSR
jgi:septal ring factor EnvC (AmiA/AmiB activator)